LLAVAVVAYVAGFCAVVESAQAISLGPGLNAELTVFPQHASGRDLVPVTAVITNTPSSTRVLQPNFHNIGSGFGWSFGSLIFNEQFATTNPYRWNRDPAGFSADLIGQLSGLSLSPGQSAQFTFGTLAPRTPPVAGGHYTADLFLSPIGGGANVLRDQLEVHVAGPSFAEVIAGAVMLAPSGSDMRATFTPNFGLTLAAAAQLGGFDHFNWFQVATRFPGSFLGSPPRFTPFIDPPSGGWNGQPADNLPFYWDETDEADLLPEYQLKFNVDPVRNPTTLRFDDTPANSFVIPGVNFMEFYTSLAGVHADGSWSPLYTFNWKSDRNVFAGGGIIGRNVGPLPPGDGGIFGVRELDSPLDVPAHVLLVWEGNGAVFPNAVPEPSVGLLVGLGVLTLGLAARQARLPHAAHGRAGTVLSAAVAAETR
jgi:hypothetical protein